VVALRYGYGCEFELDSSVIVLGSKSLCVSRPRQGVALWFIRGTAINRSQGNSALNMPVGARLIRVFRCPGCATRPAIGDCPRCYPMITCLASRHMDTADCTPGRFLHAPFQLIDGFHGFVGRQHSGGVANNPDSTSELVE